MSTCTFLFSICLLIMSGGFLTWKTVDTFFTRQFGGEESENLLRQQYADYLKQYNKNYWGEEYKTRFQNFKNSLKEISRLNAAHGSKVFGLNKFSDMSRQDFGRKMLSPTVHLHECQPLKYATCPPKFNTWYSGFRRRNGTKHKEYPKPKVDWRKRGVVSRILNQKLCNSCWAMSLVGVMESRGAIKYKSLDRLSSQELIDCSVFNYGCGGGDFHGALRFLCGLYSVPFPIVSEDDYPLMLVDQKCRISDEKHVTGMTLTNFVNACDMDEEAMLREISANGPIAVTVNAYNWQFYTGGVIQRECPGEWRYLHHTVQLVGYDLTAEVPYYIARNSWGDDYGEDGYLRLAVHRDICGVTKNVAYFDVARK